MRRRPAPIRRAGPIPDPRRRNPNQLDAAHVRHCPDFFSDPSVVAKNGQQAKVETVRELRYPTEFSPSKDALGVEWDASKPEVMAKAIELQHELARHGHHRVPIPDLVISAAAQAVGLTVLHYDSDFERISDAGGAAQEWVVPRGSLEPHFRR